MNIKLNGIITIEKDGKEITLDKIEVEKLKEEIDKLLGCKTEKYRYIPYPVYKDVYPYTTPFPGYYKDFVTYSGGTGTAVITTQGG
jgi:hypothetical protein